MKNQIYICGNGNLGSSLLREFTRHKIKVSGIFSRDKNKFADSSTPVYHYDEHRPEPDSIVFISVPDSHISETAAHFDSSEVYLVHTAGSVALNVFKTGRNGVFYPLQTFTSGVRVNWENLPVLVETNDEELLEALFEIVAAFGARGIEANSPQRKAVHVAAVFVNNFTNALFEIGETLVATAEMPSEILLPLMQQTVKKVELLHAFNAQTGPAKRGDQATIEKHLEHLKEFPEYRDIYKLMSTYLQKRYR